jgi:fluoride exporter
VLQLIRFLLICLGGAIGTGARYAIALWAPRAFGAALPTGTLIVNLGGSFLLGVIMELSIATQMIGPDARLILGTGIMGGFTTYSTFNYETLVMLRDGAFAIAFGNIAITLAGCLAAGTAGIALARAIAVH